MICDAVSGTPYAQSMSSETIRIINYKTAKKKKSQYHNLERLENKIAKVKKWHEAIVIFHKEAKGRTKRTTAERLEANTSLRR
jgi:hypothetical protein